ncbi:MAG: translocation/assembly module TamB domain-containing protein [Alphaproteobacteria bacterium]|nr:translocation/assembly module TamB domain-containing protein [Alphaproteobacteria bacterium]
MRRALRWIGWSIGIVVAVLATLVLVVLAGANTTPGQALIARLAPRLTGGLVTIEGLSGRFPDRLNAARLSVHDKDGIWATVDNLSLDWYPLRLVSGDIAILRLAATKIAILRSPISSGGSSPQLAIDIDALHVGRLDIAAALTGTATSLALDGSAAFTATKRGHIALVAKGVDVPGDYHLEARVGAADLDLRLSGREPSHGLISKLAGLPDLGPLSIDAAFAGPRSAIAAKLGLAAGQLRASAHGTIDLEAQSADLAVTATAPAMTPRPDLSWQSIALDAKIDGPFVRPKVLATLDIAALKAMGASVGNIAAQIQGDFGAVRLRAMVAGIRIPGARPDLLAANPVQITAEMRLDQPTRPIRFSLAHPLITADGEAVTAGSLHGRLKLDLPNLTPLAMLAGTDLQGHALLNLTAALRDGTTHLDANGAVGVTGGMAPVPALIGNAADLELSVAATGSNVTVSRFEIDGRKIKISATGSGGADRLALDWQLALPDLTSALPTLAGALRLQGRVSGPADDLAAMADLSGTLGPIGKPAGPISAHAQLHGLPGKPAGSITAQGVVAGSPLELALAAIRASDGGLKVTIEHADWKSAHAQGALALAAGARFPLGKLDFRMARLDDLRPLTGEPITGGIAARVVTSAAGGHQSADLRIEAHDIGLAGAPSTGRAELTATIVDPLTRPVLNSQVVASAKLANGIGAAVQIGLAGPEDAFRLTADAEVRTPGSSNLRFTTAGTVNAKTRVAAVSSLHATWNGEDLHLLGPARIGFGNGVMLDHLRLGLRQGVIEANGRVSPTLDTTVAVHNLPADLADAFAPGVAVDGVLGGDGRFTGTPTRPEGMIRLTAAGLRLRSGLGRALPAANVTASAEVAGTSARIDARMTAGRSANLSVSGQLATAPLAPIDVHAFGAFDLAMLDPLLTAGGRRVRGKISLDARVGGTLRAPRISGGARLADGAIEDFAQGVRITEITGLIEAAGNTIRVASLQGRAGPGTLGISGSVDTSGRGLPVNLAITARNARPLASDLLTAALNADMSLRGEALGKLAIGGQIDVLHAEIGIPKRMPVQVPVLEVRVAGQPPPPPPAPPPTIGLDLTVAAHQVVVRGRGLFAELAGSVKVRGSTAAPQPLGSFHMVRGNLSIAGQTLTFDKGEVGFNGGSLTDPSLDFVVTSATSAMTATLSIGGTASNPKITLTSTPELPQDEILAQVLFHRSSSSLSPFQLAEVASSLAELSGATSGGDPLGGLRQRLGLEQLSIGTGANGSAALQVGRYVAQGVYIGAQQGASGNSSQAKVEIDIAKGLKAVGTVGTGANATPGATPAESAGTSLGLKYQFDY